MRFGFFLLATFFASIGLAQDEPAKGTEYKLKIAKADAKEDLVGYYLTTGKVKSKGDDNLYLLADKESDETFLLNGEGSYLEYEGSDGKLMATKDWAGSVYFKEKGILSTSGYTAMGDVLILNGDPSPWTICTKDGSKDYDKPVVSFPNIFGVPSDGCMIIYIQCEPVSK